eukprot:4341146-Ditylum_brightwellii.AAC.1
MNLLRIIEEGDESSEEKMKAWDFDRDGNRHDMHGNEHDDNKYGSDGSHFTPHSLKQKLIFGFCC